MDYREQIRTLEQYVQNIEKQITSLIESNDSDMMRIQSLEAKKSQYLAEVRRLNRLQWDEDHERVNLDEDR
jgi:hypothetical protein